VIGHGVFERSSGRERRGVDEISGGGREKRRVSWSKERREKRLCGRRRSGGGARSWLEKGATEDRRMRQAESWVERGKEKETDLWAKKGAIEEKLLELLDEGFLFHTPLMSYEALILN
jgi:hypothetical protein